MTNTNTKHTWTNWSQNVTASPEYFYQPKSIEEVQAIVKKASEEGKTIRIVGSSHSFTPLCANDEIMLDIVHLSGIVEVHKEEKQITFYAGTDVKTAGRLCLENGLAQENLGDYDEQTLAGATSTGTHGTGATLTGIANQIVAFWIVTADGNLVECSRDKNPEIFEGGRVAMGSLGVLVKVKLQLVDSYKLKLETFVVEMNNTMKDIPNMLKANRNLEFFYFPGTDKAMVKKMAITDEPVYDPKWKNYLNQNILENIGLKLVCDLTSKFNWNAFKVNKFMASVVGNDKRINWYNKILTTERNVIFREMELNIPAEHFEAFFKRMILKIEKEQYNVFFPIEIRWVKSDDIWISPAYKRESVYIAFHTYKKAPLPKYFQDMQEIAMEYNCRPHWAKMHTLENEYFAKVYPKWEDFKTLRQRLDPNGVFLSPYMKRIFGIS